MMWAQVTLLIIYCISSIMMFFAFMGASTKKEFRSALFVSFCIVVQFILILLGGGFDLIF